MKLNNQREKKYQELEEKIRNTPLIRYEKDVANNNQIWIKNVSESAFGSHYDLPYLQLFRHYEEQEKIQPGSKVFETTSGSAGISMANIGRELGYECHIAIPEGGEQAREKAIKEAGATLHTTPKEQYVNGFLDFVKPWLKEQLRTGERAFYLNHSMGQTKELVNEVVLKAFENLAHESMQELDQIDYFMPAVGNGSSILGPGRVFNKETTTIGFEPFQAALAYNLLNPGKYEEQYGIEPGTLERSMLPGMSFSIKGDHVPIPHIKTAIQQGILEDVILVSDWHTDANYQAHTGKQIGPEIPRWQHESYQNLGRSTRAGIAAAKKLSETIEGKNILLLGYDTMERYDDQR